MWSSFRDELVMPCSRSVAISILNQQNQRSISIIKVILVLFLFQRSSMHWYEERGPLLPDLRNQTSKHAEIVYFAVYC